MWSSMYTKVSFDFHQTMRSEQQILVEFGHRVRDLRKEMNLSQEDLAHNAGLHRTYIGMIERAEKNITLINIEKIAAALNVELAQLFKWQKEPSKH
jgi:transcriptional regulator with XRE-family HTH domain